MRIGQSIWSREDFNLNNPRSSLLLSTTSNNLIKLRSDTELNRDLNAKTNEIRHETILPHGHLINSSKKLFSNTNLRHRLYEQRQCMTDYGITKTIYCFRATKISIDDTGPFWPMTFPIKHPTPSFHL